MREAVWRVLYSAVCALALGGEALARDWPKLEGGEDNPVCQQALILATSRFDSAAFFLYEPVPPPPEFTHAIVLDLPDLGDATGFCCEDLRTDSAIFDIVTGEQFNGRYYWQRTPHQGQRLIIHQQMHSWRGDLFSAAIDGAPTPEAFLQAMQQDYARREAGGQSSLWIREDWMPPMVVRNPGASALWLVDRAQDVATDWTIRTIENGEAPAACTIHFAPPIEPTREHSHDTFALLPRQVRRFVELVDATLGDGRNEGTLNPTARQRWRQRDTIANAALRPWALHDGPHRPYNSRAEIDAALNRWARTAPSFAAIRADIARQYPIAERALASHYRTAFALEPAQARAMAAYAMDILYRTPFVFPENTDGRPSQPNPWPRASAR